VTEQELADLLASGAERSDVEFKSGGRSDDKKFFAKIVRAVLALTNRRDGGVVLIGIDEQPGGAAKAVGVDPKDLTTWTADVVRDRLAVFADPSVDIQIGYHLIDGKTIVSITVHEFDDVRSSAEGTPTICEKAPSTFDRGENPSRSSCHVKRRCAICSNSRRKSDCVASSPRRLPQG
jgi:predicted HTH transcriptional regulator